MAQRNRPFVSSIKPDKFVELRPRHIEVYGRQFKGNTFAPPPLACFFQQIVDPAPVDLKGIPTPIPPPVASSSIILIDEGHMRVEVPATLPNGDYTFQVRNAGDAYYSDPFPLSVYVDESARPRRSEQVVNQMVQPLPVPFSTRVDSQRIASGSQFNGKLPDRDQGRWLSPNPPTQGGRWVWPEDVEIIQFLFKSNGPEPVGRTAGSGLFLVKQDGAMVEMLYLDGVLATDESIRNSNPFFVHQGEELQLITFGATLEMVASVAVRVLRPYLGIP